MSFWNSGLLRNLEDGKLPKFEATVTLDKETINRLAVMLLLVIVISILSANLIKHVAAKGT